MATSYTSLLGFALPVTGELDGTWGTTVNNSITELVEDSIAATATASVTSGNWTLSTTGSGATNEARCAIIIPTGSPGVSRNVIAPSQSKAYIVVNQSDADVVFKGAATTGVTITAGDKALVAWNGSDFIRIGAAAGGSNTQVQYNNNGGFAGSANLTFNGTTLTSAGFSGPLNGTVGATTPSTVVATQVDLTSQGDLRLQDAAGGQYVALQAPATVPVSYTLTLPTDDGNAGQFLQTDGAGNLIWSSANAGDVVGPASSTANSIPTFNGTTGKLLQNNSGATISSGVITATGFSGPINGSVGATTPSTGVFTQVNVTAQGDLRLEDTTGGQYVGLQAPSVVSTSYVLTLPAADGTSGQVLQTDGAGNLSFADTTTGAGGALLNNTTTISENYTIPSGTNSLSVGPITISDGYAVTVSSGQRWIVL